MEGHCNTGPTFLQGQTASTPAPRPAKLGVLNMLVFSGVKNAGAIMSSTIHHQQVSKVAICCEMEKKWNIVEAGKG